jgi:hypothetical protein
VTFFSIRSGVRGNVCDEGRDTTLLVHSARWAGRCPAYAQGGSLEDRSYLHPPCRGQFIRCIPLVAWFSEAQGVLSGPPLCHALRYAKDRIGAALTLLLMHLTETFSHTLMRHSLKRSWSKFGRLDIELMPIQNTHGMGWHIWRLWESACVCHPCKDVRSVP